MSLTADNRLIPLTDTRGSLLLAGKAYAEPEPDSLVLINGQHGTAWQRHAADGLWHSTRGGKAKAWAEILASRNVVLVYDAPVRSGR